MQSGNVTGGSFSAGKGLYDNPNSAVASASAGNSTKGLYDDPNSAIAAVGKYVPKRGSNVQATAGSTIDLYHTPNIPTAGTVSKGFHVHASERQVDQDEFGPAMGGTIMETNFDSVSYFPTPSPVHTIVDSVATNDNYGDSIVALLTQVGAQTPPHSSGGSASASASAGPAVRERLISETRFDVPNAGLLGKNPQTTVPDEVKGTNSGKLRGSVVQQPIAQPVAIRSNLGNFSKDMPLATGEPHQSAGDRLISDKKDALPNASATKEFVVNLPVAGSTSTDDALEENTPAVNTQVLVPIPPTTALLAVKDECKDAGGASTVSAATAVSEISPSEPTASISQSIWAAAGAAVTSDGLMSAGAVATRLQGSGLAQKALRTVWSEAKATATTKSSAGTMNKEEFAIACDLAIKAGGVFPE